MLFSLAPNPGAAIFFGAKIAPEWRFEKGVIRHAVI
jgi:hypothetical protein